MDVGPLQRPAGLGAAHQVCLAHILCDARYARDEGDAVFAPKLARLLAWAVRVGRRRAELRMTTPHAYQAEADRRLDRLLRLPAPTPAGRALQAQAKAWHGSYFVFLEGRAVPTTNNVGERALRPSMVFRKVTHGFRSASGADAHAQLRTVIGTARLAGITVNKAIASALAGMPPPPPGPRTGRPEPSDLRRQPRGTTLTLPCPWPTHARPGLANGGSNGAAPPNDDDRPDDHRARGEGRTLRCRPGGGMGQADPG